MTENKHQYLGVGICPKCNKWGSCEASYSRHKTSQWFGPYYIFRHGTPSTPRSKCYLGKQKPPNLQTPLIDFRQKSKQF
jgi:hypothetical protein